jgi:Pathogenicity locus
MTRATRTADDDLRRLPGVGPATARDLRLLGIERVTDLRGRDPEALFTALQESVGHPVDRCVLYVFRCAVYHASAAPPDPELRSWWRWTDDGPAARGGLV